MVLGILREEKKTKPTVKMGFIKIVKPPPWFIIYSMDEGDNDIC